MAGCSQKYVKMTSHYRLPGRDKSNSCVISGSLIYSHILHTVAICLRCSYQWQPALLYPVEVCDTGSCFLTLNNNTGFVLVMCWLTLVTDRCVSAGGTDSDTHSAWSKQGVIFTAVLVCHWWQQRFRSQTEEKWLTVSFKILFYTCCLLSPAVCVYPPTSNSIHIHIITHEAVLLWSPELRLQQSKAE